ncbi:hypothetical protein V8C37DRAFT_368674 [Trichoderma ceciliae]
MLCSHRWFALLHSCFLKSPTAFACRDHTRLHVAKLPHKIALLRRTNAAKTYEYSYDDPNLGRRRVGGDSQQH